MRNFRFKIVVLLAVIGFMAISSARVALAQADEAPGQGLQGTWVVQVSTHDCSSGTPIGLPFLSLLTFADGGTITETTSNPMFFPAVRGPGHGVWSRTGYHTYKAASMAFITLNGALVRTQTITQAIELQGTDEFETTAASVTFYAPDGSLLATGCATATGKRFK